LLSVSDTSSVFIWHQEIEKVRVVATVTEKVQTVHCS